MSFLANDTANLTTYRITLSFITEKFIFFIMITNALIVLLISF